MARVVQLIVIIIILMVVWSPAGADISNHRYERGDPVPLYVSKIGPYLNPSETYAYYNLPFCQPDHVKEKKESLGLALNGDHLVSAPYILDFLVDKQCQVLCRKNLTKEDIFQFQTAIAEEYVYQMYYDDFPLWAFVGIVNGDGKQFLITHIQFKIYYNGDRVIDIRTQPDLSHVVELLEEKDIDMEIEFLYSVEWKETATLFEKRMEKYKRPADFVHWLSIMISFILMIYLVSLDGRILRRQFSKDANDQETGQVETGWKILRGDVFRYPKYKSLFSAALGSGIQLLIIGACIITLGLFGVFHPYDQGVIWYASILIYAVTSGVAGFVAVSFYHQLEGRNWVKTLILTGCLIWVPLFLMFCFLNSVAISYNSTAALPLSILQVIFFMWIFLALPLLLLGGILGKTLKSEFRAPYRASKTAREIPSVPWRKGCLAQMAWAGVLSFGVIHTELHYIIYSIWGYTTYTTHGILFIVFILLVIVTALASVGMTSAQLLLGNHEWWWRSFLYGGSTGIYVYGFCLYYYFQDSEMSGFLQTSFFFGYMACICYGLFLMLGTVGFYASLCFVRYVYGPSIKKT